MRIINLLALGIVVLGCYYESPHPIGAAADAQRVDALEGSWITVGGEGQTELQVARFDERTYLVELHEDGKRERYRAYVTDVGRNRFLNVQPIEGADRPFVFFRFEFAPDTLRLMPVRERAAPKFSASAELRAWLEQHADDALIYGETVDLRRQ